MKKSICGFVDYILEKYFALSLSLKKKKITMEVWGRIKCLVSYIKPVFVSLN